jgi:TRAP-type C4-dicarboxylate transport system permease small subunit
MDVEREPSSLTKMDKFANAVESVMIVLTVSMVVLVTYQVFGRYVLHYTPPWSEEMAVYLMIWFGMIGIAAGLRRDAHMSLHYFADKMPQAVQRALVFIKYGLILIYTGVLTNEGINMVLLTTGQKSPAMGLTISYVYLSLPVSMVLMAIYTIELLFKELKKGRVG